MRLEKIALLGTAVLTFTLSLGAAMNHVYNNSPREKSEILSSERSIKYFCPDGAEYKLPLEVSTQPIIIQPDNSDSDVRNFSEEILMKNSYLGLWTRIITLEKGQIENSDTKKSYSGRDDYMIVDKSGKMGFVSVRWRPFTDADDGDVDYVFETSKALTIVTDSVWGSEREEEIGGKNVKVGTFSRIFPDGKVKNEYAAIPVGDIMYEVSTSFKEGFVGAEEIRKKIMRSIRFEEN
jgi:hypothetical protein